MHYSIQQDLARDHYDGLLREASRAHLAAIARGRVDETSPVRFEALRGMIRRLHIPHVRPVAAH
jgi:hypothetical protein